MDAAINTAIDAGIDQVVALFTTNLPLVFSIFASLISIFLIMKLFYKFFRSWYLK